MSYVLQLLNAAFGATVATRDTLDAMQEAAQVHFPRSLGDAIDLGLKGGSVVYGVREAKKRGQETLLTVAKGLEAVDRFAGPVPVYVPPPSARASAEEHDLYQQRLMPMRYRQSML